MQVDEGSFVRNREALVQKYQNANMSPDRHASYLRLRALKRMWRMEDVLSELQALTPAAVQVRCCCETLLCSTTSALRATDFLVQATYSNIILGIHCLRHILTLTGAAHERSADKIAANICV